MPLSSVRVGAAPKSGGIPIADQRSDRIIDSGLLAVARSLEFVTALLWLKVQGESDTSMTAKEAQKVNGPRSSAG